MYSIVVHSCQVMTGEHPFRRIKRATSIPTALHNGERPERPSEAVIVERGLDARLWDLLTRCWEQDPYKRPTILEVLEELD